MALYLARSNGHTARCKLLERSAIFYKAAGTQRLPTATRQVPTLKRENNVPTSLPQNYLPQQKRKYFSITYNFSVQGARARLFTQASTRSRRVKDACFA